MTLSSETANILRRKKDLGFPFFILLFYIFVEYARPRFLSPMRPALVAQILLAWFLMLNMEKVFTVLKEKFFRYYLVLLTLMILHIFLAANRYTAFMTFQMMLTYFIVGISFCVFLDSPYKFIVFCKFFVGIMAICAVDRLAGIGVLGAVGTMGDENDFALAMNVALPISFFLSFTAKSWRKALLLVATLLFVLGTMKSASRGGFLSLVAVGGCCWLYSQHKIRIIVMLLVLGAVAWNFAAPDFKEEVLGIGLQSAESDTGKDRVELWKVGWRAFKDNPILGVGQGNMPIVMETYQYDEKGESYWQRGLWGRAVHSIYLTLLPEFGIVGTLLFVAIFKDLLSKHKQTKERYNKTSSGDRGYEIKNLTAALMVSIFGFMISGVFLSSLYYPEFWNLSALSIAAYLLATKKSLMQ